MSLAALLSYQRETEALAQIAGRLGWDQETVMPQGAAHQRAEESAALEGVLHARRADPRLGAWLAEATSDDPVIQAQLREITREHQRATKVPARLAQALAHKTSLAQGIWAEARATEDVAAFLPTLTEIIALKREEAEAMQDGHATRYDALLADHEPGASGAWVAETFARMRPSLVSLRERALAKPMPKALAGRFDARAQLRLAQEIAVVFGYDLNRGRIDQAVHPFSSGSGADVRITTRTDEADLFNCLYSTIHEVGHAAYEQNIRPEFGLTAVGRGASMGVHESQSRIYENQIGRSKPFTFWLFERLKAHGFALNLDTPEAFYAAVNRLEAGYIRTEADEVHYNLHIMLRFDLERALIEGDLAAADLEAAWNDRFAADFGTKVTKPSEGMLQDVHWSVGLFGYFPTYALGNIYAGCLHQAIRAELPDLDQALSRGDTTPATDWLKRQLQQFGALNAPSQTIEAACGFTPSEAPLLAYLETKFSSLYEL